MFSYSIKFAGKKHVYLNKTKGFKSVICWNRNELLFLKPTKLFSEYRFRRWFNDDYRFVIPAGLFWIGFELKIEKMSSWICALVFCFRFLDPTKALPEIFSNYFSECRFMHNYDIRQALYKNFFLARKQKAMGHRSLQYRGTKFWNELPNFVKSANHYKAFVKLLISCHLIASYYSYQNSTLHLCFKSIVLSITLVWWHGKHQ